MDPQNLIETFGTIGILAIIFAESGVLAGFFLPGDSLLFTAGLLASQGDLNIAVLLVGCPLAAIVGDQVGYIFGRRVGPALFRRPDSRIFRQSHVEVARDYFAEHGSKTIVLARFVPIVRTFAPVIAGVAEMPYRTFVTFNVIGGLLWGFGVTLAGFLLGQVIPHGDRYLYPIIAVIVLVSFIPVIREALRHRRERRTERAAVEPPTEPTVDA
ncbi:MAG TPA: VTT domain-containing protein [Acidimicrobiales bacterium]|nr:VTT domain-containing protein [Acidimicrobiales bacterium]